jgi:hypothetical protein
MKTKLNGDSPDLLDGWMMREWFDLQPANDSYMIDASGKVVKNLKYDGHRQ